MARELAVRDDGFVVIVESETQQHVMSSLHRHLDSPGAGLFTLETDRARVGRVLVQMVWKKLQCHLEQGDMHNFRYLLSTQDICCLSGLGFLPLEGLMPGFVSQADPFTYPEAFAVERFLHDTGFKAVSERDSAGWTPMCYAVLSGKQFLVEVALALTPLNLLQCVSQKKVIPDDMTQQVTLFLTCRDARRLSQGIAQTESRLQRQDYPTQAQDASSAEYARPVTGGVFPSEWSVEAAAVCTGEGECGRWTSGRCHSLGECSRQRGRSADVV